MKEKERRLDLDFSGRSSGILLHLTSLPGDHGSGDLGPGALRFIDFLERSGQTWWQMLPIGPAGHQPAFSPYDSASSFAGSPWLISLTRLAEDGLLSHSDIRPVAGLSLSKVNFPEVIEYRDKGLHNAFGSFLAGKGDSSTGFRKFCRNNAYWLDDYSLFMALKHHSGGKKWTQWDSALRQRKPDALFRARKLLEREINLHRFIQFEFDRQWKGLRTRSFRSGIGLIGDLPIFTAYDSADVWSHQELFRLDKKGVPLYVSGYPPDKFNKNGQHWGHPQYRWQEHEKAGFAWWVSRFARMYELFDAVRIDHFLGFTRTWSIPSKASSAGEGLWVKSPGVQLLSSVMKKTGPIPMIAEDLGHVTAADIRLRDMFGMAPMRIFQFGFGSEENSAIHLPHNYEKFSVAYTGNHDMNTIPGWFRKLSRRTRDKVLTYTGGVPESIHWDCLRTLQGSAANVVIFPVQDILGLGTRARMNVPGTIHGNWNWRMNAEIPDEIAEKLFNLTDIYGRTRSASLK